MTSVLGRAHFTGTFATEEDAVAYARGQAARSRKFAVFVVYTGTPKNEGRETKHRFRGEH